LKEVLKIESQFSVYSSWDELEEKDLLVLKAAKEVSTRAYAPYSQFKVGAAILLDNDVVVTGSNQENAAFPSGLCAERVALFAAHSTYPEQKVLKLAVYATGRDEPLVEPVTPCGACRQVISEYEDLAHTQIEIFMASDSKVISALGIATLLPLRFQLFK
jgi:cytidine deaminase